jgi:peptidoglycan/LPS O-acetylase OafA/YrhL
MCEEAVKKEIHFFTLDSLRGLAALSVFFFHCELASPHLRNSIFRFGVTGVDLFFMISGFVITLTLRYTNDWWSFLVKRFTKLYPIYWVIVSFTAVLILLKHDDEITPHLLTDYLGNLTMLQRYFGIPNLDEQYWTLEVEILFYVFILVILLCRGSKSIEPIGTVMLIFCIVYDIFLDIKFPIGKYFILINHFPLFYSGIIFFKIRDEGGNAFRYVTLAVCFVSACILFNNGGRSMYYLSFSEYLPSLLIYFIVFALAIKDRMKLLTAKPLLFMGRISYSFYLLHQYVSSQLIIPAVLKYISGSFYVAVCIALVVCICLAFIATIYIEEPSVRWGKAFLKKKYIEGSFKSTAS